MVRMDGSRDLYITGQDARESEVLQGLLFNPYAGTIQRYTPGGSVQDCACIGRRNKSTSQEVDAESMSSADREVVARAIRERCPLSSFNSAQRKALRLPPWLVV